MAHIGIPTEDTQFERPGAFVFGAVGEPYDEAALLTSAGCSLTEGKTPVAPTGYIKKADAEGSVFTRIQHPLSWDVVFHFGDIMVESAYLEFGFRRSRLGI